MRTVTEAAPPTMPKVPIPPPALTDTAEKRPTLPGRAHRTTTNTETLHTMPKDQGLRPAVTPTGAPQRIQPAREPLPPAPMVAAHIMPKDQGLRLPRAHMAAARPITRELAQSGPLLLAQPYMPAITATVEQPRFTIPRSLSTPTLRAATTAEAGPRPGQRW